jgi:hypothetical protein
MITEDQEETEKNANEAQWIEEQEFDTTHETQAQIKFLMDSKGFMYYLTKQQGHFKIKEINPLNDHVHDHIVIFEIKSEQCYGFYCDEHYIYFIGDSKIVTRLKR